MNKSQLQYTKDLSVFVHHTHQQPMAEAHVKKIAQSIAKGGYWASKPIGCVRIANKLTVIDGHHRLEAAKRLGVGVYYVVEKTERSDDIGEENYLVRKWSNLSFAKMYANRGNTDYAELIRYSDKFGIPLRTAASLLRGEAGHSCNAGNPVRTGSFTIKTRESIGVVVSFIDHLGASCPVVKTKIFIEALSILLFVREFDHTLLMRKIDVNPRMLEKCNNRDQMLTQIEDLYNFRTRDKVPLAFLAKKKMAERGVCGLKTKKTA